MTNSIIVFNPANNKPIDVAFGTDALDTAEEIVSAFESAGGKHTAYVTYREFDAVWVERFERYQSNLTSYKPSHRKEKGNLPSTKRVGVNPFTN